jgi:hypothetical protein
MLGKIWQHYETGISSTSDGKAVGEATVLMFRLRFNFLWKLDLFYPSDEYLSKKTALENNFALLNYLEIISFCVEIIW